MKKLFLFYCLLVAVMSVPVTVSAQSSDEDYTDAFITVDDNVVSLAQLREAGLVINARYNGFLIAKIRNDIQLSTIKSLPGVNFISQATRLATCCDTARYCSRVDDVQAGVNLETPYTGNGVIVGVIDCGFDFNHINFMGEDGVSRVKAVYMPMDNNPNGHSPVINRIMLPGCYYENPEQIRQLTTDDTTTSHGTQVAGIAAGSYRDNNWHGIAPEADIVACGIPEDKLTDARVAYCITYINDYARRVNKPYVINISLGSHVGLHDGSSYLSRVIEQMSGPGKVFVVSAGNDGGSPVRLHHTIADKQDTIFTMLSGYVGSMTRHGIVQAWSKDNKVFNTKMFVIDTRNGKFLYRSRAFGATAAGTEGVLSSEADEVLGQYCTGSVTIQAGVEANEKPFSRCKFDSLRTKENYYIIGLQYYAPSQNEIVSWGSQSVYFARYGFSWTEPAATTGSINDIATNDSVISVGSYNSKEYITLRDGSVYHRLFSEVGELSYYSSLGPDENGVQRPDVCAPGSVVISSASRYHENPSNIYYWQPSAVVDGVEYPYCPDLGTSMSAPVVAGSVALWLQANPTLGPSDIRRVLKNSCYKDEQVLMGNSIQWGYGKLDTYAGLQYVLNPNVPTIVSEDVNRDGEVNIRDINAVIGVVLSLNMESQDYADVNNDGEVNISDINAVIQYILTH